MSWLFSQALVAAHSDQISWVGIQSAQLNVMPTQHKFWRNDKMMEFSSLSRFGLTLQLLTEDLGEELLTLYLADFHAKTSARQVKASGSMESVQAYGQKWHELSVKYDQHSCSWKTHQCLWEEDLPESSVILPKWGMTRNGHVFQHPTLERPINVTESGLLPTPKASDSKNRSSPADFKRNAPGLSAIVHMWPTPKASDWNKRGKVSADPRNGLPGAVISFPTPTASDANKWSNESLEERKAKGRQVRLNTAVSPQGGAGGMLNPDWVEWLMGWPIGWTDLKPLEMDKFQKWQEAHF